MAWIGAAIGAVGGLLSADSKSGGGAGSSSSNREPWAMAVPWLLQNLNEGSALQSRYQAQPISARQRASLDNQYAQSDYMRGLIPGLLGQLQRQPVGFDKKNPNARAQAWDWNTMAGGLGQRSVQGMQSRPEPIPEPERKFVQQDMGYSPVQQALIDSGRSPWLMGGDPSALASVGATGGYGAYRYGDTPTPGTQAYRDMQEFFLMGGNDPRGLSQFGVRPMAGPGGFLGNSGNSVGGSPAADGSGGGTPGGNW
ncbi:hypothetical protein [Variovorax sp. RA8]|uniref:hypothetical protein n=1 Tax=Variovorax sp. (strain JCM 16519 / RA8) TaxID=662548 RepID=UPI00131971AF|nr:hypothetical protein [Variovorax sp. RA8]VTU34120.1 hypothetical protein RA8CHR_04908 [Variovorax sp. RA8]